MEATRSREREEVPNAKITPQIPSAPEYDQESLSAIDNDSWGMPELIDRNRPTSFLDKIKNAFKNYKISRREEQDTQNLVDPIANNGIDYSNQPPPYSINDPNGDDPIFGNLDSRNIFLRKLYGWLILQQGLLTTLAGLFTYVPHFRHMFRKLLADKIFLRNYVGGPIGFIFIGLLLLQPVRRKFPAISFAFITLSLCSLLCYLMSYEKDNAFILMELAFFNASFISASGLNYLIPKFNLKNRWQTFYFPPTMGTLQGLQPLLSKRTLSTSWYLNLTSILAVSYLGYNISSVTNNSKLNLKPTDHLFGATEVFISPISSLPSYVYKKLRKRNPPSSFERI